MQLDNYTSGGLLRRWRRNALGFLVCTFDAVDPARLSSEARAGILAANEALAAEEESLLALEAARRLVAGGRPDRYEEYIDEAGETRRRETEAYRAFKAAEELVAGADPALGELADLRAGIYPVDEETGEPIVPVDEPGEDTLELLPEPPRAVTYKSDIFARATDEETLVIKAGVEAMGPRLAAFFDAISEIRHAHPLFPELMAGFADAFGEQRANELLAPSA